MNTNQISRFPFLSQDKSVKELLEIIQAKEIDLGHRVTVLQLACHHTFKKIYEFPDKVFENEKGITLSKECTQCGITVQKPKGPPWEICEKCWGEMEFKFTRPGQGERTRHYECTQCRHDHSHT